MDNKFIDRSVFYSNKTKSFMNLKQFLEYMEKCESSDEAGTVSLVAVCKNEREAVRLTKMSNELLLPLLDESDFETLNKFFDKLKTLYYNGS